MIKTVQMGIQEMTTKIPRIPVMEIFGPTIQGEGLMTGTVTHFLRTGGCGLRCTWCDTLFAVEPKQIREGRRMMTLEEIYTELITSRPYAPYVTFTGGDPCIHEALGPLVTWLNVNGVKVAVETQGQLFPEWLESCDVITFSPKPPSSGNVVDVTDLSKWLIDASRGGKRSFEVCIKIVVFNKEDFEYAMQVYREIPYHLYDAFYFTAGTPMFIGEKIPDTQDEIMHRAYFKALGVVEGMQGLAKMMLDQAQIFPFSPKVHLGCQQHVLLWPDKTRGV